MGNCIHIYQSTQSTQPTTLSVKCKALLSVMYFTVSHLYYNCLKYFSTYAENHGCYNFASTDDFASNIKQFRHHRR